MKIRYISFDYWLFNVASEIDIEIKLYCFNKEIKLSWHFLVWAWTTTFNRSEAQKINGIKKFISLYIYDFVKMTGRPNKLFIVY